MLHKLPIITVPNPLLREPSTMVDISTISDPNFQNLLDTMIHTMYTDDGIGLAAPQIAVQKRIIVIGKDAFKTHAPLPFDMATDLVLINPELENYSWRTNIDEEGCLSVPDVRGDVERHTTLTASAFDRFGIKICFTAHDYFARVLQHEVDHINGVLFIDRARKVFKTKTVKIL